MSDGHPGPGRSRREVSTRLGTLSALDVGAGPVTLFVHGVATNALLGVTSPMSLVPVDGAS